LFGLCQFSSARGFSARCQLLRLLTVVRAVPMVRTKAERAARDIPAPRVKPVLPQQVPAAGLLEAVLEALPLVAQALPAEPAVLLEAPTAATDKPTVQLTAVAAAAAGTMAMATGQRR
jgi:hypothetical protein